MKPEILGLIIGGGIPALFFAVNAISTKASSNAGIGIGLFVILTGLAVAVAGVGFFLWLPDKTLSLKSGSLAVLNGLVWGIGSGCVALALNVYKTPLAKLVPLYNMNTLIAVLLALWIFAEWKQVRVPQLLIGSLLIVVGGTMVSKA